MGRSPCCDESGLKKGPWTPEEDQILVKYIQKHGHGSWRALPKLAGTHATSLSLFLCLPANLCMQNNFAGLNRCGKSCRLRWTNYLRPDVKRGKFSQEEEQTILNLHSVLGNKYSTLLLISYYISSSEHVCVTDFGFFKFLVFDKMVSNCQPPAGTDR